MQRLHVPHKRTAWTPVSLALLLLALLHVRLAACAAAATTPAHQASNPNQQQTPSSTCQLVIKSASSRLPAAQLQASLVCSGDLVTIAAHTSISNALKKTAQGVRWDPDGCDNLSCLLTICGASSVQFQGAEVLSVRDQGLDAALCIGGNSKVLFNGGSFSGAFTRQGALLVLGKAQMSLQGTSVANNTGNSTLGGLSMGAGLVVQDDAQVLIAGSHFVGNYAYGSEAATGGGVVVQDSGSITIEDSLFERNEVTAGGFIGFAGGAAVYAEGAATVTVRNTTFVQNSANGSVASAAGAICVMHNTTLRLDHCLFDHNVAVSQHAFGGALAAMNSTVINITDTNFSHNSAFGSSGMASGAGILVGNNACIAMTGGSLVGNFVNGSLVGAGGGACVFENATFQARNVLFSGNKAVSASSKLGALGGGLSCLNTSRCWLDDSVISDNHANCSTAPAAGGGLGAYDQASVKLMRCNVLRNWVKGALYASGGGVFSQSTAGSLMLLRSCIFDDNSAVVYELTGGYAGGGAVGVNGTARVELQGTNFTHNSVAGVAATGGGAVHVNGSVHVSIESCQFIGNWLGGLPGWNVPSLTACGGALGVQGPSVMSVDASLFRNNTVDGMRTCGGAACAMWAGLLRVHNSQFVSNHAAGASLSCGGGICAIDNGTLDVLGTLFDHNQVSGVSNGGGACSATNSTAKIAQSIFRHNTASWAGGAVGLSDGCHTVIQRCSFVNNTATNAETGCGGAVGVGFEAGTLKPAVCSIQGSIFSANSAMGRRGSGGAVYTNNAVLKIIDSAFTDNAAQQGGGLGGSRVSWELASTVFTNHSVPGPGGAIFMIGGLDATLQDCKINHNR